MIKYNENRNKKKNNDSIIMENLKLLSQFFNRIKTYLDRKIKIMQKIIRKNNQKYKGFYDRIQLTIIYLCAIIVLLFSVVNYLGDLPEDYYYIIPFLDEILSAPILRILFTPEKTFFIYVLIIELIINRSIIKISLYVKFHILLILILEMIENLIISYWDLFFIREIEFLPGAPLVPWSGLNSFMYIYLAFVLIIYLHCYIQGLRGNIPRLPGVLQTIPDSVAFWLKLRKPKKD